MSDKKPITAEDAKSLSEALSVKSAYSPGPKGKLIKENNNLKELVETLMPFKDIVMKYMNYCQENGIIGDQNFFVETVNNYRTSQGLDKVDPKEETFDEDVDMIKELEIPKGRYLVQHTFKEEIRSH